MGKKAIFESVIPFYPTLKFEHDSIKTSIKNKIKNSNSYDSVNKLSLNKSEDPQVCIYWEQNSFQIPPDLV